MNTFNEETDYSGFNDYNMAPSDNQEGPEQQMSLMVDSESSPHSAAGKRDSALTAFLRSKKQNTALSGTQHTSSTFDTFAQEQEWEDDDDDDESIVSIDINDIKNEFIPLSSYKVKDDESIISIDMIDDITKNDFIPAVTSYNEGAVDEALKWTEAFMAHDDNSDEESVEEAPLHDSMSSLNDGLEKLTKCMERSALSRQLITQYSEKSLGSSTSTTTDISPHSSFNHHDSLELQDPLVGPSSSHPTSSGLVRPRIKKAQSITRSGLIRRHSSHRAGGVSAGQDHITKRRGIVKKDSLVSRFNGSLNSISFHGDPGWRNLSRSSSARKTKLSQETSSRSLMDSSSSSLGSLPVKARLSQNVKVRVRDVYYNTDD
jgi:hypothetical protein